jgi:hypothetical protein
VGISTQWVPDLHRTLAHVASVTHLGPVGKSAQWKPALHRTVEQVNGAADASMNDETTSITTNDASKEPKRMSVRMINPLVVEVYLSATYQDDMVRAIARLRRRPAHPATIAVLRLSPRARYQAAGRAAHRDHAERIQ